MYESFTIKNFRCFEDLTISDLKRVNLIAGKNNSGKTALLEALFIHSGAYNPDLALRVNMFRNSGQLNIETGPRSTVPWDSLFSQFDTLKPIELAASDAKRGNRQTRLNVVNDVNELAKLGTSIRGSVQSNELTTSSFSTIQVLRLESKVDTERVIAFHLIIDQSGALAVIPPPPQPQFVTIFQFAQMRNHPQEDAARFGNLVRRREDDHVLKALKIIEPRLKSLASTVAAPNIPTIIGDIGLDLLVPLTLMGDGLTRLASIIISIITAKDGIVLIDEIENGLHYSTLPDVWRVVDQTAKEFNTQIFATTHSRECIVAAHEAFDSDAEYDFRLHRLDRINDTIRAVTYPQGTLEAAIETNLEVR